MQLKQTLTNLVSSVESDRRLKQGKIKDQDMITIRSQQLKLFQTSGVYYMGEKRIKGV